MPTKQGAIQTWASQFCTAYPSTAVPHDAELPFITYALPWGGFGDMSNMTLNLYVGTESELEVNNKGRLIDDAIGMGGVMLKCDGGAVWLTRGTPFCQAVQDEPGIKRLMFNVNVDHLTI